MNKRKARYCKITEEGEQKERVEQQEKTGETESGHSLIISQQCNLQCPWFLNEAEQACKLRDRKSLNTLMNHYPTNESLSSVVCKCT